MDTLIEWLPKVGATLTFIIGLVGLFKPRMILDHVDIALQSPSAYSEARAVFGGMNLGMAVAAFTLGEPLIFTALGIAWGTLLLARFYSLAVDNIGMRASLPGMIVDGTLCFLFLSPSILG